MAQSSEDNPLHPDSLVVSAGRPDRDSDSPLNSGVVFSATYNATSETQVPIGYGRYGNQNWSDLEEAIGALEKGKTLVFSSGMAAISAALSTMPKGSKILAARNGYTGTMKVLTDLNRSGDYELRFVDISNNEEIEKNILGINLIWLESPTNPALEVADLKFIVNLAKKNNCLLMVDNTFATPLRQKPLELGADLTMNAVTKFIAGHSDVVLGSLSTNSIELFQKIQEKRSFAGAIPGPMEVWLALRGMRTMAIRLDRSESNAMEIAKRLQNHPLVSKVRYPGLPTDPFHDRAKEQMSGFGAVLSFEVKGSGNKDAITVAKEVVTASKLIHFATSLGGVETLWERRHRWGSESPNIAQELIRISVGIENIEDLWRDISQALDSVTK